MPRSPIPPKVRWQVLARDGFRCRYCGVEGGEAVLVVDHNIPVARGGRNDLGNLMTACETCNAGKSDAEPPNYSDMVAYREAAARAMRWLVDIWCEITGETIDWMPMPAVYMTILRYAATYQDAAGLITMYAEAARDGEGAETLLQRLWDELRCEELLR